MNNSSPGRRAASAASYPPRQSVFPQTGMPQPPMPPAQPPASSAAPNKPSVGSRIVGVIGELLITAGIVIALFIVWQLWWTTIIANWNQNNQVSQIQSSWGDPNNQKIGQPRFDEPPAADHPKGMGDLEGIIYIPRFGSNWRYTVKYGVDLEKVLDTGSFGHNPDTAYVGEVGNYATAAHRLTYGNPMQHAPDIQNGDSIIVQTDKAYYVYKQIKQEIVDPTETRVIEPNPFDPDKPAVDRLLSITTCDPPLVSSRRLIVFAKFDHWVDVNDGVPAELHPSNNK